MTHRKFRWTLRHFTLVGLLAMVGTGCGASIESQVINAATAHIAIQGLECGDWQIYRLTPADIHEDRRSLLDGYLSQAEQRQLAEQGGLYAAACPSFGCHPFAFVSCPDGRDSCRGVIDNFVPITCTIITY